MYWSQKTLYDRLMDRLSQAENRASKFNDSRDIIAQLFRPDLEMDIQLANQSGDLLGSRIYENTGVFALNTMTSGFMGNTVSQYIDWIMYIMGQYELKGIDQLDIWCQDVKEYMSDVYRKSNFYDVMPKYCKNAFSIGSPIMIGEEDIFTGRIVWTALHYKNSFVVYNALNEPDGLLYKDPKFTAKQIYDTYTPNAKKPEIDKKLSTSLVNALEQGMHNNEFTVFTAIFRANDPVWNGGFEKPKGDYKWLKVVFEYDTVKDKNNPLSVEVYFSRPFVVWDYDKNSWDTCSRTPAFYAIWDTLSHQQVYKNFLENVQYKNRPPVMHLNSMANRLELWPEGLMSVDINEYEHPPKALDTIGDILLNKEVSDIFVENVKRHFHLDEFQRFNNLARENRQPVTALQIMKMAGENSILLSPAIESQSRVLRDIDARCMDIEARAGRGPFDPARMADITDIILQNSKENVVAIKVLPHFTGALFRAQKMAQELDPIQAGLEAAIPLLDRQPDLWNAIRMYGTLDDILTATNFPKKNLKTEEEYNEFMALINEQRQKAAEAEQALTMSKAAKSVSGKVDPTSVMAGIGKAVAGAA